jgi:hypothetical protein
MLPSTLAPNAYVPNRMKKELDWAGPIQLGAKQMKARRVQEQLTLNKFAVDIDNDFGAATEKRVKDFQAAKGLPVTGIVDQATWEKLVEPMVKALKPIAAGNKTLSELTVAYARQHVAQHPVEAGGDNRGPWVRAYLDWDGPDARWCAGFTCYALEQAANTLGIKVPVASSASCDVLANGAKTAGLFVAGSKVVSGAVPKANIVPGSFFLVRKTPTDWVHVGIVKGAAAQSFDTVEGNTDSGGSSNGFEAAERARAFDAKYDFILW